MNKILSNVLFYSAAITVGGLAGTVIAINQSGVPEQIKDLEVQVEEAKQEEPKHEEPEQEEEKKEEVKKEEPKTQTQPVKTESKPAQSKPVETKPTTSTTVQTPKPVNNGEQYVDTGDEYLDSIMGLCPSQRDKNAKWEDGSRLVSIGVRLGVSPGSSEGDYRPTLKQLIASNWNNYKKNGPEFGNRRMMASLNNIYGFDKTWSNSRVAFFMDWNGLFIRWDNSWEDGKSITVSEEQRNILEQMASDGTNYLRWLDSTYNAKCPND